MSKITETYNDQAQKRRGRPPNAVTNGNGTDNVHVIAAHEPLSGEPFSFDPSKLPTFIPTTPTLVEPGPAPVAEPAPLKIAMIGTAPSSRMLAPFNDPSWTIWACSPGNMNVLPRVDVWFELHGNLLWPEHKHYGQPYIEWLSRLTIPVFMQDQAQIPHAKVFPHKEMVAEFGKDFFTSSFAWMMAYAIKLGAKEIALYGIDMASRDEYILQRPGFYFFRHIAQQRGIKVSAPNESDIMQSPGLYGYSDVMPMGRKILAREQEIKQRLEPMKAELQKLQQNITYLEGALEDVDYFKSIWMGQHE